jgi:hypothetical protein
MTDITSAELVGISRQLPDSPQNMGRFVRYHPVPVTSIHEIPPSIKYGVSLPPFMSR